MATVNSMEVENRKILVVDDSPTARLQARNYLSKGGYEVLEAEDGQLGYYSLLNQVPLLIISDVDMPKLDGFGLLSKIRKDIRFRHLPVLFITGDLTVHLGDDRAKQVNGLLHKPYIANDLLAQVQFLLSMQFRTTCWRIRVWRNGQIIITGTLI